MIDDQLVVRSFLAANTGVTDLTGTRIYGGRDVPVEGWTADDGSCLVFKRRGMVKTDESGTFMNASYQFKCYGSGGNDNQQLLNSEALYRALRDALQFGFNYGVMGAQEEGGSGVPLREPDTERPYTLCFFRVQLRKTS